MRHLVWGSLSTAIGLFLVLATIMLANTNVMMNLLYGGIFIAFGLYRLNQYREVRTRTLNTGPIGHKPVE